MLLSRQESNVIINLSRVGKSNCQAGLSLLTSFMFMALPSSGRGASTGRTGARELLAKRFGLLLDDTRSLILLFCDLEAADILEALSRGLLLGDGE